VSFCSFDLDILRRTVRSYEKSLKLDPQNTNEAEKIKELRKK